MNVWNMTYDMWIVFARAVDDYIDEQSKKDS